MKRLFFSNGARSIAAAVGLAMFVAHGDTQTLASRPIIVTESTAVGEMWGRNLATGNASIVTLGNTGSMIVARNNTLSNQISSPAPNGTTTVRYFITDLGTLGGTQSFAYALNDWGQVVGESSIAGDTASHAFLYSNGRMIDLFPLNSEGIQTVGPTSINNLGQIASGVIRNGVYMPAIFNSSTGSFSLIGSLGGITSFNFNGVATSINNSGKIVGYSYIDSLNRHAFLSSSNVISDLGSFGGYSGAFSINDQGVIVGFASDQSNGVAHAFMYSGGVMMNIHPSTESYARDINNNGEVVGDFLTADQSAFHAFLYVHGTFSDLGLADSRETVPFAINDRTQIVGTTDATGASHAFLYSNGMFVDLNSTIQKGSGWELAGAFDINNNAQIVGSGLLNNKFHAFVLTPAISKDQCKDDGWKNFGFKNQGDCIQFVNTSK